jgi:hypothetical protein
MDRRAQLFSVSRLLTEFFQHALEHSGRLKDSGITA